MATGVPALECSALVWRLVRKKSWLDADTDGLSVGIVGRCTLEEFQASLKKVHGVVSLHVGRVRDLSLDVLPDDPEQVQAQGHDYDPCHANIVHLPCIEDDPKEAERLAGLLARQSRWVAP